MSHETTSDGYYRFHVSFILDVDPERYAKYPDGMQDALNGALSRLVELVDRDPNLQAHFKRHQLEFGWERPSWDAE